MIKNLLLVAVTLIVMWCIFYSIVRAEEYYGDFKNVEYIKNYDGDTISVNIKGVHPLLGKDIDIRVNGIDTPEMRGGCAESKALAKTAQMLVQQILTNARRIDLRNCYRPKYFRIGADVYADGVNIADILIDNNLAVPYDGGTKTHTWCE